MLFDLKDYWQKDKNFLVFFLNENKPYLPQVLTNRVVQDIVCFYMQHLQESTLQSQAHN